MKGILCAVCVSVLVGCGNDTATERNRPGSGSSTLRVTANVSAELTSGGPVTSFEVDVRDGMSNKVSGATVTISADGLGDIPLVEADAGSGKYVNSRASFPSGDFKLSVTRNADNVRGVVVGNPGSHAVNAPARSAVVQANQPLPVSWTTPSTAKSASIKTKDFSAQVPDTGSYTIPAANNTSRGDQKLELSRFNEVDLAGGLTGSRLRVTFTAVVEPYIVQ